MRYNFPVFSIQDLFRLYYFSWNPFRLDLSEAEELLSKAEPGAFIFSHDVTSELFLSIA